MGYNPPTLAVVAVVLSTGALVKTAAVSPFWKPVITGSGSVGFGWRVGSNEP
jgi:hypothetical protein